MAEHLMESNIYMPTYEVFVILEAFAERFHDHLDALRPLLTASAEGPLLLGCDCYYREATDVALLGLRLDERTLTKTKLASIVALAQDAERPLLDPRRLTDDDRRSFYREYLVLYDNRVEDGTSMRDSIDTMAERLGIITSVREERWAVGTESGPVATEHTADTRPYASPPPLPPVVPKVEDLLPPIKPVGKSRQPDRAETVPGSRARARAGSDSGTITVVHVRFLRGDSWMPGRLRGLNMKSARIATGAPPREGDEVQLAIGLGDLGVVVHGTVNMAQTGDAAVKSGFAGFDMEFPELTKDARSQLRALLIRARERGLSLKPPPPRAAVRFPLNWPVRVQSDSGPLALSVLDISIRGLFVATQHALPDEFEFQLPDELGGLPITGRARVVREVTEKMARDRGLEPGYGVELIELADEERYERFVKRVERRCETRILVGASRARATALTWDLAALGYTVSTTTDPAEVARAASGETRPPDLAILDDSLTIDDIQAQLVRQVFIGRQVPCIAIHGAKPEKTRKAVDQLLIKS